jgi:hypothetical protein
MIPALLRLFALRPLFTVAILGFPLILLVIVGLLAIYAIKFLVFVILPLALIIWLLRTLFWNGGTAEG